jgi:hypothetical protein
MKYGFVLKDFNGNTYRTIATSLSESIEKIVYDHDLKESEIVSCSRGDSIQTIDF